MADATTSSRRSPTAKLGAAHQRFARVALLIYLGAATVGILALTAALVTDRTYDERQTRDHLALETQVRAHWLERHLTLLATELGRLGMRSEIDLLDQNLAPEKSLLELSHRDSALFNLGVAIVDRGGQVLWAEPAGFVPLHRSFAAEAWFRDTARSRTARIVAVNPAMSSDAAVWLVAPILRAGLFAGALVGGIDLVRGTPLGLRGSRTVMTVLATQRGEVVYPAPPPPYAAEAAWREFFRKPVDRPQILDSELEGTPAVVAISPVQPGRLALLSVAPREALFGPARHRMFTRITIGISLALVPLGAFVWLLRRSLGVFQRSEEEAVREDRIRLIGEAANQIAHEVRNSINGLKLGLDLVLRGQPPSNLRVVNELRAEFDRLSGFTHQLMLFAKGPDPRKSRVDLAELVPAALSLTTELANELGVEIELVGFDRPVLVDGDPVLLRIVVTNLVSNALDALTTVAPGGETPKIVLELEQSSLAELRVIDNGPGIAAAVRPVLFEPFATGKPSGVGIGLALARKVARAHGGDLLLDSERAGTCFRLILPRPTQSSLPPGVVA